MGNWGFTFTMKIELFDWLNEKKAGSVCNITSASQPASQPASKPTSQPAHRPATQPAVQPASELVKHRGWDGPLDPGIPDSH